MMIKRLIGLGLWLCLFSSPTLAQQADQFWNCVPSDVTKWCPVNTNYPLPVTISGTGGPTNVNVSQLEGNAVNLGAGATGTGTLRIVTASDDLSLTSASTGLAATNPNTNTYSNATTDSLNTNLNGALYVQPVPVGSSVAINVSTATTTQLVALSGTTLIYVTSFDVIAGGTGNITFVYGTGSACGTGTTSLTGAYPLIAQAGISKGNGAGAVLKVPAGNALCVTTSASVQMSGSVSYQQF